MPRRSFSLVLAIAFSLLLVAPAITVSQDASPPASGCVATTVDENIALVEELWTAVGSVDAESIDRILADGYAHNQNRYGLPDDPTSNQDEVNLAVRWQEFYPGTSHKVDEIFGVGNQVVAQSTQIITEHNITGQTVVLDTPIEVRTIGIYTIECGEIVSLNALVDELGLLIGLGAMPVPVPFMEATPAA